VCPFKLSIVSTTSRKSASSSAINIFAIEEFSLFMN
jgi:hypothetical protein